jgi:hypothetical protein
MTITTGDAGQARSIERVTVRLRVGARWRMLCRQSGMRMIRPGGSIGGRRPSRAACRGGGRGPGSTGAVEFGVAEPDDGFRVPRRDAGERDCERSGQSRKHDRDDKSPASVAPHAATSIVWRGEGSLLAAFVTSRSSAREPVEGLLGHRTATIDGAPSRRRRVGEIPSGDGANRGLQAARSASPTGDDVVDLCRRCAFAVIVLRGEPVLRRAEVTAAKAELLDSSRCR